MAAQKKGITITVIILVIALLLIIAVWKVYEKKMERMEIVPQTQRP